MAKQLKLGKIERLPVREIWPDEAHDFTPWLAREENLALLGETCSMDLEPVETESSVGSFSADILAQESGTGKNVVIENQLENTNHDHLGKLITYAAGKAAEIVIWIVAHARDEHRQAIEWLNSHTDDGCSFFLVEVEVLRIGESDPAPQFNVIESPNEWARIEKTKTGLTDTKRLQVEYWQAFREAALADSEFSKTMRPQKAQPQHWTTVHIGSSRYHLSALMYVKNHKVAVELYISGDKEFGQVVFNHADELEKAVGCRPQVFDGNKDCGIRFFLEHVDTSNRDTWPDLLAWQLKSLVALREAVLKIDS